MAAWPDVAALLLVAGGLFWGAWRGSARSLLLLAAGAAGLAAAFALYPVTAVRVGELTGLPLLASCAVGGLVNAALAFLLVYVPGARRRSRRAAARLAALAEEQRRAAEAAARADAETGRFEDPERVLAEEPPPVVLPGPGVPSRLLGALAGATLGALLFAGGASLAPALNAPREAFPPPVDLAHPLTPYAARSRTLPLYEERVLPHLRRVPALELAPRLARLARAARELDRAGPAAVAEAGRAPAVRALLDDEALSVALDDPSLAALARDGHLAQALRHPRLLEVLRRPEARAALRAAPLDEVLEQVAAVIESRPLPAPAPSADPEPQPAPQPDPQPQPDPEPAPPPAPIQAQPLPDLEPAPTVEDPWALAQEAARRGAWAEAAGHLEPVPSAERQASRAAFLLLAGDAAGAAAALRELDPARLQPARRAEAAALLVCALARQGQWTEVRAAGAIDAARASAPALLAAAELALAAGDLARAEALLLRARRDVHVGPAATARLARVLRRLGLAPLARRAYGAAALTAPPAADGRPLGAGWRAAEGILALEAGDLASARAHLATALADDPQQPHAHHALGVLLLRLGAPAAAAEAFAAAAALDPEAPLLQRALGDALFAVGLTPAVRRAAQAYQRAVDLDPVDAAAWQRLGLALEALGDDAGLAALERAVELAPADPGPRNDLGLALLGRGRAEAAARAFAAAWEACGEPALLAHLALARQAAGDAAGARAALESARAALAAGWSEADPGLPGRLDLIAAGTDTPAGGWALDPWARPLPSSADATQLLRRVAAGSPDYLERLAVRGLDGSLVGFAGAPVRRAAHVIDAGAFFAVADDAARRSHDLETVLAAAGQRADPDGLLREAGGARVGAAELATRWRLTRLAAAVDDAEHPPRRSAFHAARGALVACSRLQPPRPLPPPADPLAGDGGGPPRLLLAIPTDVPGLAPPLTRVPVPPRARAALGEAPPPTPDAAAAACAEVARALGQGSWELRPGVAGERIARAALRLNGAPGQVAQALLERFARPRQRTLPRAPVAEATPLRDVDPPLPEPDPQPPERIEPGVAPDPQPPERIEPGVEPDPAPPERIEPGVEPDPGPPERIEPDPQPDPQPDPDPQPEPVAPEPQLSPSPLRIRSLYAASNRYAQRPRQRLRQGERFAFRALLALEEGATPAARELSWEVLGPDGAALPAFAHRAALPPAAGERAVFVEGVLPADLAPGGYTVRLAASLPERAPVSAEAGFRVVEVPLVLRALRAVEEPGAAPLERARPGQRVLLEAEYEVRPAVADGPRRVLWQIHDAAGAPVPGLAGARRLRGGRAGVLALSLPLELPADLPPGRYRVSLAVEAGGERCAGGVALRVAP